MKNKKIKYGKKDLVGGPVSPSEESVRISIMLEGDLLDAVKRLAKKDFLPYQTKLKQMLRRQIMVEDMAGVRGKFDLTNNFEADLAPVTRRTMKKRSAG